MEKQVVLPAPFGPISPRIWPCSSVERDVVVGLQAAESLREMLGAQDGRRQSSPGHAGDGEVGPPAAQTAVEQAGETERLEEDDQHQQRPVDAEVELRVVGEQVLLDDDEDHRAQRGAEDGAHPADHPHQHPGDRPVESEHVARLDVAEERGVEAAADADGQPREKEHQILETRGAHSHVAGGIDVALDREEREAQRRAAQRVRGGDGERDEDDAVPVQLLLEVERIGSDSPEEPPVNASQ